MRIQETIGFNVERLLQRGLDSVKSSSNANSVANPESGRVRRMRARFNQRRPDEIQERMKRGYYNVKI